MYWFKQLAAKQKFFCFWFNERSLEDAHVGKLSFFADIISQH